MRRKVGAGGIPLGLLAVGLFIGVPLAVEAAQAPPPNGNGRARTIETKPVGSPPRIDGRLDDECWQAIEPASGFVQYDPANGSPASEETLVWTAYDRDHLYFAFHVRDSQPDRIWAELTPRNGYWQNDSITIILDTYNDRRTSIEFTVNALGVQSNSVETIWRSQAVRLRDGWSAEVALPFKSLRFSNAGDQVWGVNFSRYIKRLNERDYWAPVDRDRPLLLQMGDLRGLADVRPGRNVEFFPYAGARASRWAGEADDKAALGLDVKYGIRSNLILDLTASPDFSEVESDPFIYQLAPYENYLREHRPFFTEGSQYFQSGGSSGFGFGPPGFSLFYSRRIADPKFAAKLTGKAGAYSFGLLGAANGDVSGGAEPFTAFRVKRDVLGSSQVGLFVTGAGEGDRANRNVSADYQFRLGGIYSISGSHALTFNAGDPAGDNAVHSFSASRYPDAGLSASFSFNRVEKNVATRTGFVGRTDVQTTTGGAGYGWRLREGAVKHVSVDATGSVVHDTDGGLRGQSLGASCWLSLRPDVSVSLMTSAGRSQYQVLGERGLQWAGRFMPTRDVWAGLFWSRPGWLKGIHANASWARTGVYTGGFAGVEPGRSTSVEGSLTFRPRSDIEIETGAEYIRQEADRAGAAIFSGLTYEASLHYQVTRALFLSGRLRGESREDQYHVDLVAGYYFGAGNVAQVAYKRGSRLELGLREQGYSITAKVSYLLRL